MAERRMFAKTIVESDAFLSQSVKAQCLYLHLGMSADDDGILNNALTICRSLGFKKDALDELIANRFLLDLGDGITIIKHWQINNRIQTDRHKPSVYQDKLQMLSIKDDKSYTMRTQDGHTLDTDWTQIGHNLDTQVSIGKYRLVKNDEDIQKINNRLLEMSIPKDVIDKASIYHYRYKLTKEAYLKVVEVLQNDEIIDKDAYIYRMVKNEQDREAYA